MGNGNAWGINNAKFAHHTPNPSWGTGTVLVVCAALVDWRLLTSFMLRAKYAPSSLGVAEVAPTFGMGSAFPFPMRG